MTNRTWDGKVADWLSDADWTAPNAVTGAPLPGDTAIIASGAVTLTNSRNQNRIFDNTQVVLGGAAGATLLLKNTQPTGRNFNVTVAGNATIEASGVRGFAGAITGNPNDGSTVTFKADANSELVLLHGGALTVTDREIDFQGMIALQRNATFSGNIVNNGTLSIESGKTTFASNSVAGTGTIAIGSYAELVLSSPLPATQTITFTGLGGELALAYNHISDLAGRITGFQAGDFIDFLGFGPVTSAGLDTTSHSLTINDSTGRSYVVNNFYGAAGALSSTTQANGHDLISYVSAAPQLTYQIDAGARAMHADVVQHMTVPSTGVPVTGTGVKVGIISTSFNLGGGAAADKAAGYLPASGVTVLTEGAAGNSDEGRAMAELVHQTAPGASLYFAATGTSIDTFAAAVRALQAAGCSVIVDDISLIGSEPFFQLGDPAEIAISNAIAAGVTFVTAVGNYGNAYYEHAFTTSQQTLLDGSVVNAMSFSNGTPYQSITAAGGLYDQIDLQWDAPFYGVGGVAADQPDAVTFKVFDATTNTVIGTAHQVSLGGYLVAESELVLPYHSADTNYRIAIYDTGTGLPISEIKYVLSGASTGAGIGGRINDPDAGVGSGAVEGHQMVPGAIAVAATDVTNTDAFGQSPSFADSFSSSGLGTLLFDANGNRLAQPITAGSPDVTGPDGINTSVTGFAPFYGTSAAAPNVAGVAALLLQVDPTLTPGRVAQILAESATSLNGAPAAVQGAGLVQADKAVAVLEDAVCYCSGTLILTDRGERRVETLAIGDRVLTASGAARPIRWIGHRTVDCRRHARPEQAHPIRILRNAFGENRPAQDLSLSPAHSVCVDVLGEVLIPICALANGSTIAQVATDHVTYWHVELDSHDILVANGLPAESYIDMGNRRFFVESDVVDLEIPPDGIVGDPAQRTAADFCRPFITEGPILDAVRLQLRRRSDALGWTLDETETFGDLHLVIDGERIDPEIRGLTAGFVIPAGAGDAWLVTRSARPCDVADAVDVRHLGICVTGLTISDGLTSPKRIPLDDALLSAGFYDIEDGCRRWTAGRARLPAALWTDRPGAFSLLVEVAGPALPCWVPTTESRVAGSEPADRVRPAYTVAAAR